MSHRILKKNILCMLVAPFLLAACGKEPEFDRNFKKSCEATSNGNTRFCKCALGVVQKNIEPESLPTLSSGDIEKLAPEIVKTCNAG